MNLINSACARQRRQAIAMRRFTVKGPQMIWPVANWDETSAAEQINVRGWFPLLDKMADEFLIWRPQGGCFFVHRDKATYRIAEHDPRNVLFLQLELNRMAVVPPRPNRAGAGLSGALVTRGGPPSKASHRFDPIRT